MYYFDLGLEEKEFSIKEFNKICGYNFALFSYIENVINNSFIYKVSNISPNNNKGYFI